VIEEAIQSGLSSDRLTSMFQECLKEAVGKSSKASAIKNTESQAASDTSNEESTS
jgi:hypothetical protein